MKDMLKKFEKCDKDSSEPLAVSGKYYTPPPSYNSNQTYYAPTVVPQPPTYQPDTELSIPTFLPTDDPIANLNKAMIFLSLVYRSKFPPTKQTSSNPRTQATIQNGQKVLMAKQCTTKKKVKDSEWFKDKMLLAQAQEAGVVLDEEQQDFLADSLEETDDYYNDKATANAVFMTNLSPVGSLNDDTIAPRYDSDTLSELGYIENIISTNESYDELKGSNVVICYTDYMLTIGDDADNYVPPPIQKNDMMLFLVEQIKSQVYNYNKVWICQILQEISQKRTRERMSDQEAKEIKAEAKEIMPQPSTGSKNNKLRAQLKGKFSESQTNHRGTSVNTKLSKPSTSGTKLYLVTLFPKSKVIPKVVEKNDLSKSVSSHLTTNKIIEKCTKVLAPGLLKIESELINAYFKNNRAVHHDYLRVTKEHVATLQELLEQAITLKPLDEHIGYASKFAARIQELLVYVSASCRFTQSGNEKWAPVTSHKKNNKPYVDASRMKQTIETITKVHAVKQNTCKTDNTMLPSTGRVSFTTASGSKPRSNTKNDRIPQSSNRSMKNKVEARQRKFKSSVNKNNHVSDCNANVKNVALSKNSNTICLSCNECLFSANHDACVVQYL
ncbi:hypothetical protein Tco_0877123 [Tanacetum coccineum]|uniref:Uncharacterized protein n=1 Tax=Tanacetum coccineum TaxID=301880 RepID=A0ABQ5BX98_9ASTR